MAESIIAFVILLLVAGVMILIGISQIKSKEPVGFYSGEKPPKKEELSDVKLWNIKHGRMWLIYGLSMIGASAAGLLVKTEIAAAIIMIGVIVGALPIMIWYHSHLKKKYYKSN